MYNMINENVNRILDNIGNKSVTRYDWLAENLQVRNVAVDMDYQRRYRAYWIMNVARLSPNWYAEYFGLLETQKNLGQIELCDICGILYNIPTQENRHTLQFSFSTKLIHMVNRNMPIYDRMVKDFYYLPETNQQIPYEQRLANYIGSFNFLNNEYRRVINDHLLDLSITAFRERFNPSYFTEPRIIDSLIWSFVDIAKRGGFQDGTFTHR